MGNPNFQMDRKVSVGRKLSTDMHRKLSQISNCSDVSNISFKLGLDPDDFKSTIQNILGKFMKYVLAGFSFSLKFLKISMLVMINGFVTQMMSQTG